MQVVDKRIILISLFSALAITFLSVLIPVRPSASYSYVFGFNNRAAVAILCLGSILAAIWTRGFEPKEAQSTTFRSIPLSTLIFALALVALGCYGMYRFAGSYGGFGESSYAIDRCWLITQGKIPYRDFEWAYGAGLLYVPVFLSHFLHLPIWQAFYIVWALCYCVGTAALFLVIQAINFPAASKGQIFALTYAAGLYLLINMSSAYTYLRYACPLLFVLVFQRLLNRSSLLSDLIAVTASVSFSAILLLISPETAVGMVFASAVVFWVLRALTVRSLATFTLWLVGHAALIAVAAKHQVMSTLLTSGGGSESLPVPFAPYILIYFFSVIVCACFMYQRVKNRKSRDNTIGLIAYSIPLTAAALGHCNPGHVMWNGLGIFICCMFYLSNYPRAWRIYRAAFLIVFVVFPTLSEAFLYLPSIGRVALYRFAGEGNQSVGGQIFDYAAHKYVAAFGKNTHKDKLDAMFKNASMHPTVAPGSLREIYSNWQGEIFAPFGYKPDSIGSYLSGEVDYGRFEAFENANSLEGIAEKVNEIRDRPGAALLLPFRYEELCEIDLGAERREISVLSVFPYNARVRHTENVRLPVCSYIAAHYVVEVEPSVGNFWYGLWINKSQSARQK